MPRAPNSKSPSPSFLCRLFLCIISSAVSLWLAGEKKNTRNFTRDCVDTLLCTEKEKKRYGFEYKVVWHQRMDITWDLMMQHNISYTSYIQSKLNFGQWNGGKKNPTRLKNGVKLRSSIKQRPIQRCIFIYLFTGYNFPIPAPRIGYVPPYI